MLCLSGFEVYSRWEPLVSVYSRQVFLDKCTCQGKLASVIEALRQAIMVNLITIQYNTIQYNTIQYNTIQYFVQEIKKIKVTKSLSKGDI